MSEIPPQQTQGKPSVPTALAQPSDAQFRPPLIDLSALNQAWPLFRREMPVWIAASVAVCVVLSVPAFWLLTIMRAHGGAHGENAPGLFTRAILLTLATVALNAAYSLATAGMFSIALKQLKGETVSFRDLFDFRGQGLQILLAAVLVGAALGVGEMALLLPGFWVGGLIMFAMPIILDRKLNAVEAIKLSVETLKSQMWMAAIVYLILSIVVAIGVAFCIVGAVVTLPMAMISLACMYTELFWKQPNHRNVA